MKHYTTLAVMLCLFASVSLKGQPLRYNFRVQVAAFATEVSWDYFRKAGLDEVYMQSDQNEIYRYYLGEYESSEEAEEMKLMAQKKGFKYAQVIDLKQQRELCGTPCPYFTENTVYAKLTAEATFLRVIFFDYNSNALKLQSMSDLDHIYETLKAHPKYSLRISGHTDSKGDAMYNIELAKRRVRIARNYLVSKGINIKRFKNQSLGESIPIAINKNDGADSPEGRRYNRRVVIAVLDENGELLQDLDAISKMVPPHLRVESRDLEEEIAKDD